MISINQIHQKVAEAIIRSGLTQKELGEKLNVKQSTVSHYIKGDKMPSLETFANLCAILDVDANDMLCIKGK